VFKIWVDRPQSDDGSTGGYPAWSSDVGELSAKFGETGLKFYSFELKKELTFSNLRESFFQAVSNSSWAHEGYLVAAEVSADVSFAKNSGDSQAPLASE
jgi:hypothetical protein